MKAQKLNQRKSRYEEKSIIRGNTEAYRDRSNRSKMYTTGIPNVKN